MILIISKKEGEESTDHVMDWLKHLGGDFFRLNGKDFIQNAQYDNNEFSIDGIELEKINIVWNRRWFDGNFIQNLIRNVNLENQNILELNSSISKELRILSKMFFDKLKLKKWLSNRFEITYTKMEVLEKAHSISLKVPNTTICTKKENLVRFKKKHLRIITKAIVDPVFFTNEGKASLSKTIEVTDTLIDKIPITFFPSLFQKLIEKKYEIRVFFLDNKFYSMAIFSQLDKETQIDFRNYNEANPNRTVPYKLPQLIESKLKELIDYFKFTTGSIDLIKGVDDNYYFLEVNPVGQFGMTSFPCNYYLEKKIAKYLIDEDK